MSKIEKAKGFKHSKPGLWLSIGTSAFGALGVAKDVRKAAARATPCSSPTP